MSFPPNEAGFQALCEGYEALLRPPTREERSMDRACARTAATQGPTEPRSVLVHDTEMPRKHRKVHVGLVDGLAVKVVVHGLLGLDRELG
jgi:hypothetical protein